MPADAGRPSRLKTLTWQALLPRWPRPRGTEEGYTLLLPVPADLPVFLDLALANAARQDGTGRAETLVIPDAPSRAFAQRFERARERFDPGPMRLVEPSLRARALRRLAAAPAANYFLQVHAGICEARTRHVLLHDADLFLEDPEFMRRHHRMAADTGVGCLGVSPIWDAWLPENGYGHVVPTWELMIDTRWARSFAPYAHRPHHAHLAGEWHSFDVTLWPQAVSDPATCMIHEGATDSFEHFNYVIGAYRNYQRSPRPYEDYRFLLLLVRLLSDAFESPIADVPAASELATGIGDASSPVTYSDPATAERYAPFRAKLQRVLDGPLLEPPRRAAIEQGIAPFDRAFGS